MKTNHLWVFGIQLSKNPQNQHKNQETQYMDDTKSNPYTLIAGFLLPRKVNKNSTRKEQQNNNEKPCAWILPVLQCLQNPRFLSLFQGNFSQKVKKSKKSKSFRLFEFFIFFFFSTFRAEISWNGNFWTFRLFDFSRSKIVIFTV